MNFSGMLIVKRPFCLLISYRRSVCVCMCGSVMIYMRKKLQKFKIRIKDKSSFCFSQQTE